LAIADGGTGSITTTQARTNLGLNIGSDVQAYSSILTQLSAVSNATDKLIYFNTPSTAATTDFTSLGRSVVGAATAASLRTTLGLGINSDIMGYDADLAALAALATNGVITRTGAGTVATRTITAGTNITVTNGDGVSGNPTIAVSGLATVATSGSYNDLANKPTIVGQVQSNWTQTNNAQADFIKNKPTLATVATSGSYADLSNKPSIPAAQVNSDWNATTGFAQIFNKPALSAVATTGSYNDLANKPSIPTVPTLISSFTNDSGYARTSTLATVATTGSYNDLANKPSIPTVPTNVSVFNNDAGYASFNANGTLSLPLKTSAPSIPQVGQIALADNSGWDPLSKAGTVPYLVIYTGSTWVALA